MINVISAALVVAASILFVALWVASFVVAPVVWLYAALIVGSAVNHQMKRSHR